MTKYYNCEIHIKLITSENIHQFRFEVISKNYTHYCKHSSDYTEMLMQQRCCHKFELHSILFMEFYL